MKLKKLLCLSAILSVVCSTTVYATEPTPSITMIEHNLSTGEVEETVYQNDTDLTDSSEFLNKCVPFTIIGDDDREPIDFPTSLPFSAIGKLSIIGPNGNTYGGTGFLVSDDLVLTAGHCLDGDDMGGHAVSITFRAGLNYNGTYLASANATESYLPSPWENERDMNWDWALLRLDKPIGASIGFLSLTVDNAPVGKACEIYGYPVDWSGGPNYPTGISQVTGFGHVIGSSQYRINYDADTEGGMSGAPIFIANGSSFHLSGIHTNGILANQSGNSGVRITSAILTVLNEKS